MADLPWRKLYCNMLRSDKFEEIYAMEENPQIITYCWVIIILIANDVGRLIRPNGYPHNIDSLSIALKTSKEDCERAVSVLLSYHMLEFDGMEYSIRNFEEYQQIDKIVKQREQARLRQQKHRKGGAYEDTMNETKESTHKENKEEVGKEDASYNLQELREDFNKIYAIYPKKGGKSVAFDRYRKWVSKTGYKVDGLKYYKLTPREIWIAVKRYISERESENAEIKYYKNFDTLMGRSLLDYLGDEEDVS